MHTTIYIRKEDELRWKELGNKSQWISDMLNGNATDLDKRIKREVEQAVEDALARREQGY